MSEGRRRGEGEGECHEGYEHDGDGRPQQQPAEDVVGGEPARTRKLPKSLKTEPQASRIFGVITHWMVVTAARALHTAQFYILDFLIKS